MPEIEIKVQQRDGKIVDVVVPCSMIGSLAVHLQHTEEEWDDGEYVITSVTHGTKFPGSVYGIKAAEACARELNKLFDWVTYDKKTHNDVATKAKDILNDWGFR